MSCSNLILHYIIIIIIIIITLLWLIIQYSNPVESAFYPTDIKYQIDIRWVSQNTTFF